jgi:peptidoglycan/LPS O-acetylase OafA/YrhL
MQARGKTAEPHAVIDTAVSGGRENIPALTGLRFVAAFSILFMHTLEWTSPFNDTKSPNLLAAAVGLIGMPLFFVLSGFVIHCNYGEHFRNQSYGTALRNFFVARFARIYPLFLFFCIFGFISDDMVNWVNEYVPDLLSTIIHSLTLTQSWIYEILSSDRKILLANGFGLSWSISSEFFFYISYVFFVFAIFKIKRSKAAINIILIYSVSVIFMLFFAYSYSDHLMEFAQAHVRNYLGCAQDLDNCFYRWFFYYSPYVRIWEFILGCLTAQLFILLRPRPIGQNEARLGAIGLYVALCLIALYDVRYLIELRDNSDHLVKFFALNFGCAVPIATIIFCAARYNSRISHVFGHRWLVWLGEISYSIYAVHTWTVRPFVRPAIDYTPLTALDAFFRVGFAITFTIIVASATYRIIEVPARRYLRRVMLLHVSAAASIVGASPFGPEKGQGGLFSRNSQGY